MAKANKLSVAEALMRVEQIERTLDAWQETAPQTLAEIGGRDALTRRCEMCCIGPVPRLDEATWAQASAEYQERRMYEAGSPYAAPSGAGGKYEAEQPQAAIPLAPSKAPRRSIFQFWR